MNIDRIKQRIPDYAKDLRLNIGTVLSEAGAPGLTEPQLVATALAVALASGNTAFASDMQEVAAEVLDDAQLDAARAAAAIMGMNNVYYRFLHLIGDPEYKQLPARLRMNVIGNPGVDRKDFELYSLAVSAVNGCGMCMEAHERNLRKEGLTAEGIQSAVRIAAVVHAVARVLAQPAKAA